MIFDRCDKEGDDTLFYFNFCSSYLIAVAVVSAHVCQGPDLAAAHAMVPYQHPGRQPGSRTMTWRCLNVPFCGRLRARKSIPGLLQALGQASASRERQRFQRGWRASAGPRSRRGVASDAIPVGEAICEHARGACAAVEAGLGVRIVAAWMPSAVNIKLSLS